VFAKVDYRYTRQTKSPSGGAGTGKISKTTYATIFVFISTATRSIPYTRPAAEEPQSAPHYSLDFEK
jgi:hypothetical protein